MAPRKPVDEPELGLVALRTHSELVALGALESVEGATAMSLAGAMDDRAGVVNLSATAKVLLETMRAVREAATPVEVSQLDKLRNARAARTGNSTAAGM